MRIKLDWQGMAIIPSSLVFDKKLVAGAKMLFALLLSLREEDRDVSYKEIADLLNHSPITIKRHVENLVKVGWLKESEGYIYLQMHSPLKRKESS